jgi:hypothetical protein
VSSLDSTSSSMRFELFLVYAAPRWAYSLETVLLPQFDSQISRRQTVCRWGSFQRRRSPARCHRLPLA